MLWRRPGADEIAVIGGQAIFAEALSIADIIHMTQVAASPDGDAFMPLIDRTQWRETAREGPYDADGVRYSFVTLERYLPGTTGIGVSPNPARRFDPVSR